MESFEFHWPTKIIFERGALDRHLGAEAAGAVSPAGCRPVVSPCETAIHTGAKTVLLVTGGGTLEKLGVTARAKKSLQAAGLTVRHFSGVEPNPTAEACDRAVEFLKSSPADAIIALGGGSVMDAAKVIALAYSNGGTVWEYIPYGGKPPRRATKALPIITVPTVAATGSEGDPYAVITKASTKEKTHMGSMLVLPKVAIWDPELTVTVPVETTKDGAVDIICHMLEPYFTGGHESGAQDRLTEGLVSVVLDALPPLLKNPKDVRLREELAWTSTLALNGLTSAGRDGDFSMHEMEHPVSGVYNIPHGRGLALLLPRYMDYFKNDRPERWAQLGVRCFGLDEKTEPGRLAGQTVKAMVKWLKATGNYHTFESIGIKNPDFGMMADQAIRIIGGKNNFIPGPRPIYREDIIAIYKACCRAG